MNNYQMKNVSEDAIALACLICAYVILPIGFYHSRRHWNAAVWTLYFLLCPLHTILLPLLFWGIVKLRGLKDKEDPSVAVIACLIPLATVAFPVLYSNKISFPVIEHAWPILWPTLIGLFVASFGLWHASDFG